MFKEMSPEQELEKDSKEIESDEQSEPKNLNEESREDAIQLIEKAEKIRDEISTIIKDEILKGKPREINVFLRSSSHDFIQRITIMIDDEVRNKKMTKEEARNVFIKFREKARELSKITKISYNEALLLEGSRYLIEEDESK